MNNGYYAVVLNKKSCEYVQQGATMNVVNGDHITIAYKPNNKTFKKLNKFIGKKDGHNKNDLMKVIHYAIIQLSQDHYK